jgi:hypothetical protein
MSRPRASGPLKADDDDYTLQVREFFIVRDASKQEQE